jgi:FemAB-related protein (PEP-CTERM system-associated)
MLNASTDIDPPHSYDAISVRTYRNADRAAWESFVERCPEATFFHRIGWKHVLEEVFRHRTHYLIADDGSDIVGILPLAEVRSLLFGQSLVSLPFCVYGGSAVKTPSAAFALHSKAQSLAKELRVEHLELRHRAAKEPSWPRQDLYVTFRKEILPDIDANMLAIPRKQRAMVRKGIKAALRSELDTTVDRFFDLYSDNVHRHGTPALSKFFFKTLMEVFGRDCEVMTVVDPHGAPLSSVLSFYFRDEVLPYYAGDHPDARDFAANDFKYWELMRRACERGVKVFDYGRSKQGTGSYQFKKNWGFEPEPLSYEYTLLRRTTVPQNNPLNPKYRALIALWRRMPRSVANIIGPQIVRSLG